MSGRFFRCLGFFTFTLQIATKRGADERTRTADLLQLRVIGRALQGLAGACKSPIPKRISLLRVAVCCTVLRSRWCQSGVRRPLIAGGCARTTNGYASSHNRWSKAARRVALGKYRWSEDNKTLRRVIHL